MLVGLNAFRLVVDWLWAGYGLAMGSLPTINLLSMGWLWAGYGVIMGWLWADYGPAIG